MEVSEQEQGPIIRSQRACQEVAHGDNVDRFLVSDVCRSKAAQDVREPPSPAEGGKAAIAGNREQPSRWILDLVEALAGAQHRDERVLKEVLGQRSVVDELGEVAAELAFVRREQGRQLDLVGRSPLRKS